MALGWVDNQAKVHLRIVPSVGLLSIGRKEKKRSQHNNVLI